MLYNRMGMGGSYNAISVDPRYRDRDNDNCCCQNNGDDECLDGIRSVILSALRALGRDDSVEAEITLNNGYLQTITLSCECAFEGKNLLKTPLGVISLCDITKISLLIQTASSPNFGARFKRALRRIVGVRGGRDDNCDLDCEELECGKKRRGDDDNCANSIERFINQNSDDVISFIFDGAQAQTVAVISDITTGQALSDVTLETETAQVISVVSLQSDPVEVVTAVTAAEVEVVTAVETAEQQVVSAITQTTAEVSAPVTYTEVSVLSAAEVTDAADFAANLEVTDATAVAAIETETTEVVSGFGTPITTEGVVSGIESVETVAATAVTIPELISTGVGAMQVVIPANLFDTGLPAADVTLNVTVSGAAITFGGNSTVYALADDTTLLGNIVGTPAVADITAVGAPVTAEVVSAVTATEAPVVSSVTFDAVNGSLVSGAAVTTVNSIDPPETVTVAETVTAETVSVNTVDEVTTAAAETLFTVETAQAASAAELVTETETVLTSAVIENAEQTVVTSIETSQAAVFSPVSAEDIDGNVIGADNGVVAINNDNGDVSVYSTCAIRGVELQNGTDC